MEVEVVLPDVCGAFYKVTRTRYLVLTTSVPLIFSLTTPTYRTGSVYDKDQCML